MPVVYWLSSQEMDTATRVQILAQTDFISHCINTLGKGMNPIILPPVVGQTRFFSLGEATSLGEGKLWIQTCWTLLKNWPCAISCPSGGLGKYDNVVNLQESTTILNACTKSLETHWMHHVYIYIYIYISVATLAYFCYSCPPTLCQLQFPTVVRGPKVSHHSCYCVILHCIAQID